MTANTRAFRALLSSISLVCFSVSVVVAQSGSAAKGTSGQSAGADSASEAPKYVGSDTCKTCHEELYNAWAQTPHWKTTLMNESVKTSSGAVHPGCEGCHGPGAEHVAGGGDKSKIYIFSEHSREQNSARCLTCHGESHKQSHFAESAHSSSEVGCLDCHSPHHAKEKEHMLVQSQPQLCYGCHTAAKADFAKPYHHRVEEGLVQCNDCHNPHGTATLRQVENQPSGDAVCYKCHVDKQGPFVYEHVPVKTEGCSSCHTPHGSTNPRLLKVSVVNMLCLQCHTFPTASPAGPVHNQSAKYQACTMCHNQIHGSNFSDVFFK